MTELDLLVHAGGAAWQEADAFQAHDWWESAWLRTPPGPLREGLRALTQWAAAAHVEGLGRYAAAERIRDRARGRLLRTTTRLALAPFALDLPSDHSDALQLRDQDAPFAVTVVLLAAGQGRRAGGPKALIDVAGLPLWCRQVERLRAVGLPHVRAVLHPHAELQQSPTLHTLHGDPDATPLHSLQRALATHSGPILLLPVDCPAPSRAIVVRLLAAAVRTPTALAARPVVQTAQGGRGGHPVWLAAEMCTRIRAADANLTRLDQLLRALGPQYRDVSVADPAVLGNFNTDGMSR